jgi:ParB family chromosome partitioning protein
MAAHEHPARAARAPRKTVPELVELQDRLSERFQTRVKVALGRSKGAVTIEFADLDDLDRIIQQLDIPPSE